MIRSLSIKYTAVTQILDTTDTVCFACGYSSSKRFRWNDLNPQLIKNKLLCPRMISLLADFLLFLLLTYRFSAMFGGLFIYYGILQAVILFSVSKLLPVFHGIQQSKTAYGIKDTIKRSRTKNCPTHPTWCFWFVYVRNISYIFVHSCWEASCSVDQWDCEFRRVTEMAPYSIDPNSWMAAGVDVGLREGKGWLPPSVVGSTISWNTLNSSPSSRKRSRPTLESHFTFLTIIRKILPASTLSTEVFENRCKNFFYFYANALINVGVGIVLTYTSTVPDFQYLILSYLDQIHAVWNPRIYFVLLYRQVEFVTKQKRNISMLMQTCYVVF